MFRVVLDVNVLVSAVMRRSSVPGLALHRWRTGYYELVVSPMLLAELRDVVGRTGMSRYFTQIDAEELVAELEASANLVEDPPFAERLVAGDPADDYLVALARAGRAQVIVTGDTDLLAGELDPPALSPRDFLARLEQLGR